MEADERFFDFISSICRMVIHWRFIRSRLVDGKKEEWGG